METPAASLGVLLTAKIFDVAGITTILTDAGTFNFGGLIQSILLMFLFGWIAVQIVMKAYSMIITGPDRIVDVLGWKVLQSEVNDTEGRVSGGARALSDSAARGGDAVVQNAMKGKRRAPSKGEGESGQGKEASKLNADVGESGGGGGRHV